jgi:hypothetical protein
MTALSSVTTTYITNVANVLKKVIAPAIEQVLPYKTIWYDMLEKNKGVTAMANNTFYITIRSGRHSGIAAIAEGATLPSGKPKYDQANVTAKWVFGTFDITDQVLESAKSNAGAIVNYLTQQTQDLKDDFAKELNRMFFGYGAGALALANGNATSATLTVKPVVSVNGDIPGTEYLAAGQKIIVGTDISTILSVDSDTQVTLTAPITYATNDVITKADGDGNAAEETMGIDGIIDDGTLVPTFQGITRSAAPWYNAAYIDTTSEALGLVKMETAWAKTLKYGNPKYVFMNTTLWKKYGNLLESYKRTSNMKEILSGGWSGLDFMGGAGTVLLDTDCPDGKVFFVDPTSITIAQLTPISWVDRGDGILRRVDYASWQGVLRWYGNLAALNPRGNSKLTTKSG